MTRLGSVLVDAGGMTAPRERAAQIRAELLDALAAGAEQLALPRSGYETPVPVAITAFAGTLLAIAPVDAALHADANAVSDRGWSLVAVLVGALVEGAGALAAASRHDLALRTAAWEGWLALAYPVAPDDAAVAVDLAVEAFAENVADVDRLRARAYAVPNAVLGDVGELRPPIGELHPLAIAEAVARFGGRPADHASLAEHDEAVLAVLDPTEDVARPHEEVDPSLRVARRIMQRLMGMGKWGGYHTEIAHLARGFAGHDRALALAIGERLVNAGLLVEKQSVGQRHVRLNPRRAGEIYAFVERGPAGGARAARRRNVNAPVRAWITAVPNAADRLLGHAHDVTTLVRAGLIAPIRPDRLARVGRSLARWGTTSAGAIAVTAARMPDQPAIVDELGTLSYGEVHRRANALASSLVAHGIRPGDGVAIMCRNHRGFVDVSVACARIGANALYLNTMFAAPQLADVVEREDAKAIVYDEEFATVVEGARADRLRFVAWHDGESVDGDPVLEDLVAAGDPRGVEPPEEPGRVVILTSGTTGRPKGARRSAASIGAAASLLSKIPLRAKGVTLIAAPLFHSWGLAHFTLGVPLGSTFVLRRRFDPEGTLRAVARHRATALTVVPVMLQRILELPDEALDRHDTSSLNVIAVSGSALPGPLATRVMDRFGDVLYNLYGSTEVAWATIATPEDLRAAPGTAGRAPRGTLVKLFDEHDREVAPGRTGRIFVGSELPFEGYTGGDTKAMIGDLMSSGDVGHFDAAGRLFIDGREDDMIISGGENLFPREVEDLLAAHPAVRECAVVGVEDEEWGQRLRAVVVLHEDAEAGEDELKAYVKENLAAFKVPREVVFVDALPRNATGKVLKRDLA